MNTRRLLIGSGMVAVFVFVSHTSRAQEGRWVATSLAAAPSARAGHTAVWTGSRMVVWGGFDYGSGNGWLNTGSIYDPTADTWTPTSTANAPGPRDGHTAVWTGSRMVVWGGYGGGAWNTGASYDPTADAWTPTTTVNAPSARSHHTAVWTGSRMVVWGGGSGGALATGASYDPATDTWSPITTANTPAARSGHVAVWTGSRMIVWGGFGADGMPLDTGAVYDPTTDTWTPTSMADAPSARVGHEAVWTGAKMIVWGGWGSSGELDSGGAYNPATDEWTPTNTVNAPSPRIGHAAVWTRSRMIVWGGGDEIDNQNTGAAYDPRTGTWAPTTTVGAPTARGGHTAVWTGFTMIVWGGSNGSPLNTGGIYDPLLAQSFFTVTPCRLVDTRQPAGPLGGPALAADTSRDFVVEGHCGIPPTALAISVNLTATGQTAQGHLRLYPGGTPPPSTSSLNYAAGQTRASNGVVALGLQGSVGVRCVQASGTAHVIIDVNGYFE